MNVTKECNHHWFKTVSLVGSVFVAHRDCRVSGLLLAKHQGESNNQQDFFKYIKNSIDIDLRDTPSQDPTWQNYVTNALNEGKTDVPVSLASCSPFQKQVLYAVMRIPRGEVRSYGEVAANIGEHRAARAVGTALARNPIPLLVPCHRVVPNKGGVGNYAYGSDIKRELLAREGVKI